MAQIRYIKKDAERIVDDAFKEVETVLDSSNLPAYITFKTGGDKDVLSLSYTGSTESTSRIVLDGGIDVSVGSYSGRIVKVEGKDIFNHIDAIRAIQPRTERARNNLTNGVELIKELEEE